MPLPDESCAGIYASHVLEHLSLQEFHIALRNTRKLLRPGGIFRLVVPDLAWAAREYLRRFDSGDSAASTFFLEETCLGRKERRRGLRGIVYSSLETSAHGWMRDALSLAQALELDGFHDIRSCSFGDAEDPMFTLVEDQARFERPVAMEAGA